MRRAPTQIQVASSTLDCRQARYFHPSETNEQNQSLWGLEEDLASQVKKIDGEIGDRKLRKDSIA
jgi:hypothetical protein